MTAANIRKLKTKELQLLKANILDNLPNLDKRQIRRHRIPYHEAITLELMEDGYEESAYFLKALIEYQEEECKKDELEGIILNKPMLKNDNTMLDILHHGLMAAETGIKNNKKTDEIDNLLDIAIYFSNQSEYWWWLAEQLFSQCISSVKDYFEDGGKRNAIVRYIFGKFLFQQMNDLYRAKEHLVIARDLSNGHNWTASEAMKKHHGNLFKEICQELYVLLILLSKQQLNIDPKEAYKLSQLAQKRAMDADDLTGDAECLFQQALCEMKLNLPERALSKLNNVLIKYYSTNNKVGICNARIQLALAHSKLDNISEAKYHLHNVIVYTTKNNMQHYLAQGHRYLGELFLSCNIGQEAANNLLIALQIFHELDDYDNRELVKTFAAIANGTQLMLPYMKLINSCDKSHIFYYNNLLKLVHWKDSRAEFWEGDEGDLKDLMKYMEVYGEFAKSPSRMSSDSALLRELGENNQGDSSYSSQTMSDVYNPN